MKTDSVVCGSGLAWVIRRFNVYPIPEIFYGFLHLTHQ